MVTRKLIRPSGGLSRRPGQCEVFCCPFEGRRCSACGLRRGKPAGAQAGCWGPWETNSNQRVRLKRRPRLGKQEGETPGGRRVSGHLGLTVHLTLLPD